MPVYQSWNPKTKRWVKYHFTKQGWEVMDVKQRNPSKPFKNIPIKRKKNVSKK